MYAQLGQISKIIIHLYVVIPPRSAQNRHHTSLSMSTSLLLTIPLPSFDRIRNVRHIGAISLNTLIFICGVLPSEPAKFALHPLIISTSLLRSLPNTPPIPQPYTKYTRSPGKNPKGSSILNTVEPVEASETYTTSPFSHPPSYSTPYPTCSLPTPTYRIFALSGRITSIQVE